MLNNVEKDDIATKITINLFAWHTLYYTRTPLCPVTALRDLFAKDPQPADAPLFRFTRNKAFDY
jgi:hypothetical protein